MNLINRTKPNWAWYSHYRLRKCHPTFGLPPAFTNHRQAEVSSKALIALGNQYRELLDECPEVIQPSKFVFLGPAADQSKLNQYFKQFRWIYNCIGIIKDYWLNYCLCEIVVWPLLRPLEATAVARLHSASD